jgi:hypothetical protein
VLEPEPAVGPRVVERLGGGLGLVVVARGLPVERLLLVGQGLVDGGRSGLRRFFCVLRFGALVLDLRIGLAFVGERVALAVLARD